MLMKQANMAVPVPKKAQDAVPTTCLILYCCKIDLAPKFTTIPCPTPMVACVIAAASPTAVNLNLDLNDIGDLICVDMCLCKDTLDG